MKRCLRRIWLTAFHAFSFVWFALAIVVVFFWIRSYWVHDEVQFNAVEAISINDSPDGMTWHLFHVFESFGGCIEIRRFRFRLQEAKPDDVEEWFDLPAVSSALDIPITSRTRIPAIERREPKWTFAGFSYAENDDVPGVYDVPIWEREGPTYYSSFFIPYWFITLIIALWPMIWLLLLARGVRNLKRMARGHCGKCNYNLRGDPTADACPECGAAARLG